MTDQAPGLIEYQRTFERVCDGFVTPTLVGDGKVSGCVYRADGTKVKSSERFGGWKGDFFQSENPDVLERPEGVTRSGKGLYLGSLMAGHYGHFITEGLSTFWVFEILPVEQFDYFLFSPFVFGRKIPRYAQQCMQAFGIDLERVVIMGEEPIAFEELVVPARLFRLNHSADPALAWVHRKITSQIPDVAVPVERVYLSRRKLGMKQLSRVIANEVLVEKLFQQAGFTLVYAESLPFEDQLALYANASVVAGPSGSALHNSLFMTPGATLIELGDPRYGGVRAPTQILCDLLSGVDTAFIPFVGTIRGDGNSVSVDINGLRSRLIRVLDEIGIPNAGMNKSSVRATPAEWLECIYLSFRPTAGPLLRKLGLRR